MKTQITKPSAGKAKYTQEYKQQALELWRQSGRSAAKVGTELGIRPALLYRWARLFRADAQQGGGSEQKEAPANALHAEIRRLREENAKLLEQREVLKKSLGILCEPPHRGMPGSNK